MTRATARIFAVAALHTCALAQAEPAAETPEGTDRVAALLAAAKDGDVESIKDLLKAGTRVDSRGPVGVTPLFVAALFGRTDAAKLLIVRGADIKLAKDRDGSTALHAAAFFCHEDTVALLLKEGADANARNKRSETPLDVVSGPWNDGLGELYGGIAKAVGMEVNLERIEATRPEIVTLLREHGAERSTGTGLRCAYYMNGRIYVNELGTPEGKPLTVPPGKGWEDFKPSWSKTGDMLVFFRRVKDDPVVTNWKTAICIINVDGTKFHQLTDGTHTDFNQTWTRDGSNTPIWNRRHPEKVSFYVMASKVGNRPGQEIALTDKGYHTWAYTCLIDGRILVQSAHPKHGWGYFLMTPNAEGEPRFERIDCDLAKEGILDRISVSPSETKVCFEYQKGFQYKDTGRTLYIAGFDGKKPAMTNATPFANEEGASRWFAYPRWTRDEKAIVYHASPSLYLYNLTDKSTRRVSTKDGADYRYPHCEGAPK
ncbi:MAG: ankyrin repeat domain-containing protein [Planctomycetes bacterium]|nr:ankyrin repeat domain-containing protein [Planctomycetota bacterium]